MENKKELGFLLGNKVSLQKTGFREGFLPRAQPQGQGATSPLTRVGMQSIPPRFPSENVPCPEMQGRAQATSQKTGFREGEILNEILKPSLTKIIEEEESAGEQTDSEEEKYPCDPHNPCTIHGCWKCGMYSLLARGTIGLSFTPTPICSSPS